MEHMPSPLRASVHEVHPCSTHLGRLLVKLSWSLVQEHVIALHSASVGVFIVLAYMVLSLILLGICWEGGVTATCGNANGLAAENATKVPKVRDTRRRYMVVCKSELL